MQIGEILCEGERSDVLVGPPYTEILYADLLLLDDISDWRCFVLPYTEIPMWLNSKHQSVGNSISFRVGRKFPNDFAVCFAFGSLDPPGAVLDVYLSINGFEVVFFNDSIRGGV